MTATAKGSFQVCKWEENTYEEIGGGSTLTNMQACGRDEGHCPVARAARRHGAQSAPPGSPSAPAAGEPSH
ncbi:MAG: hypothetical protein QOD35_315 [Nocardioidaceae bacterium]|nr:hypothetical protein [Nocardioidaceae bacterium]